MQIFQYAKNGLNYASCAIFILVCKFQSLLHLIFNIYLRPKPPYQYHFQNFPPRCAMFDIQYLDANFGDFLMMRRYPMSCHW